MSEVAATTSAAGPVSAGGEAAGEESWQQVHSVKRRLVPMSAPNMSGGHIPTVAAPEPKKHGNACYLYTEACGVLTY